MLMHPGWKWQDIVEGQSLNEPLRDQSWLLTISLQLIRQGNRSPQCFTPSRPPTTPIVLLYTNKPITATDINWTPFWKCSFNLFFFFFALPYSAPISLPTRQTMYTHAHTLTHMCVHVHSLGCALCLPAFTKFLFLRPVWFYLSLYPFNLLSCKIQIKNHFSFFLKSSFYAAASSKPSPSSTILRVTSWFILGQCRVSLTSVLTMPSVLVINWWLSLKSLYKDISLWLLSLESSYKDLSLLK